MKEQQDKKQDEMDDMFRLANQYRGLDESESMFLADVQREKKRREDEKKREDNTALEEFRKAAESKAAPLPSTERTVSMPTIPKSKPRSAAKRKRDGASALGIVRKPAKDTEKSSNDKDTPTKSTQDALTPSSEKSTSADSDASAKRPKSKE